MIMKSISIHIISLIKVDLGNEADYSDMANYYREYQLKRGACIPLKERVKGNPELEMKVACTFERVKDIVVELKNAGVDKAQFCLIGWNKSGHDGRYPQLFPVEEKLGGRFGI